MRKTHALVAGLEFDEVFTHFLGDPLTRGMITCQFILLFKKKYNTLFFFQYLYLINRNMTEKIHRSAIFHKWFYSDRYL